MHLLQGIDLAVESLLRKTSLVPLLLLFSSIARGKLLQEGVDIINFNLLSITYLNGVSISIFKLFTFHMGFL